MSAIAAPLAVLFAVAGLWLLVITLRNWNRPTRRIEERLDRDI